MRSGQRARPNCLRERNEQFGSLCGCFRGGDACSLGAVIVFCVALAGLGCERDGVAERDVPKGVERIADIEDERARESSVTEEREQSSEEQKGWRTPDGWRLVPTDEPMRLATFEVRGSGGGDRSVAEVTLTRFAGDVGGELANVNRWRRQVGLSSIGEGEAEDVIERFGGADRPGYAVRLEGETTVLLAAGVYEAGLDRTWFVKSVVGSPEVADVLQPQIVAFAQSLVNEGDAEADGAEPGNGSTPPRSPNGTR